LIASVEQDRSNVFCTARNSRSILTKGKNHSRAKMALEADENKRFAFA
jgi:hypothetical protein